MKWWHWALIGGAIFIAWRTGILMRVHQLIYVASHPTQAVPR